MESCYLVSCDESPQQNKHLLVKWNLGAAVWKHCVLAINYVLKVLNKTSVKRIEIDLSMNDPEKSVVLINRQIFQNCLCDCLLILLALLLSAIDEAIENFVERRVAALDQVAEVVDAGWLVFNQDQNEVQSKCRQSLCFPLGIDCTHIRDALKTVRA